MPSLKVGSRRGPAVRARRRGGRPWLGVVVMGNSFPFRSSSGSALVTRDGLRARRFAALAVTAAAVSLLAAGTVAGTAPSAAALARPRPGDAGSFTAPGDLSGVAATSARNAWAVGSAGVKTLIVHWNGTAWKRVPSPSPAAGGGLDGVAATSARDAWAVGGTRGGKTLILRWNGTTWKRVPSPAPAAGGGLDGVAATAARNAWAVGTTRGGKTLIVHWNGTAWTRVHSPALTVNS